MPMLVQSNSPLVGQLHVLEFQNWQLVGNHLSLQYVEQSEILVTK